MFLAARRRRAFLRRCQKAKGLAATLLMALPRWRVVNRSDAVRKQSPGGGHTPSTPRAVAAS